MSRHTMMQIRLVTLAAMGSILQFMAVHLIFRT